MDERPYLCITIINSTDMKYVQSCVLNTAPSQSSGRTLAELPITCSWGHSSPDRVVISLWQWQPVWYRQVTATCKGSKAAPPLRGSAGLLWCQIATVKDGEMTTRKLYWSLYPPSPSCTHFVFALIQFLLHKATFKKKKRSCTFNFRGIFAENAYCGTAI